MISATNSALFRAANTTCPTSSAIGRVIVGAENRTGVASSDTPAVMPNQIRQIHAGFRMTAKNHFRDPRFRSIIPRWFSLSGAHNAAPRYLLNDMASEQESQLAAAVLMIRPVRFQSNPLTAASNRFQGRNASSPEQQQIDAEAEFDGVATALEANGITVVEIEDTADPHTPDAIFPNNWVSFHADGTVVLYPMEAPNRRTERRQDIIETLANQHGFQVREIVDFSHHEKSGHFLEGTGSLVLDRVNRIAYACLSSRTHLDTLGDFAQRLDYEVVAFDATDRNGAPIYHTNVLMNVGEGLAVICDEAIPREDQREAVMQSLKGSGHDVLTLTIAQMDSFAGNMLELRSSSGQRLIAMSEQARNSLTASQLDTISGYAQIVSVRLENIESSAGGSVRCMLAEIHLPSAGAKN